ncbi:hypothetical protein V1520DRAFT_154640 [Lipomyces starkeyi]|uniref:Uncharacterized protein n=1 Tax=Lipomyces starkeyi NRRL Y-11557 TaxID=675824 RepID=A0A1E3QGK3_LIPST|nr:hypothetical protein LIPSTDRAFT_67823 [Lipomyces starkeyi NRRL Y-11557]
MTYLVRFQRSLPPVVHQVRLRTFSSTSHTLNDQQSTPSQKSPARQNKRQSRAMSAKARRSWRRGDNAFYNSFNSSKRTSGLYRYDDVQAAWRSLITVDRTLPGAVPITQTPSLIDDDLVVAGQLESVGDEQNVFLESANATEVVSVEDVNLALAGWYQYEIEVEKEMDRSGKKSNWFAVRSQSRPGRSSPAEPTKRHQWPARQDARPTTENINEEVEDDELFDEDDEEFDIDEHDGVDEVYEGDAKSEEQWREFVQSLSLRNDVKKFIAETSETDDAEFEKEVEKLMKDLDRKLSSGETVEITEDQQKFIEETEELLDDVEVEQYSHKAMERDVEDAIRALGISSSSAGDAGVVVLEQQDGELDHDSQPEVVAKTVTLDRTSKVKRHQNIATIVPNNASEEQKMEIFTSTIDGAPDMLNRDQAREYLPLDFPSPIRVPFEDIVKSGNYIERPVVDDRDLRPTEIYGDYSRWTELEDKRYAPALMKNASISPADKAKMAAIIDRFVS